MEVFRIARTRYVADLTGTGARLYGGRWNHEGSSLIYTSSTRALATVEFLVHVPIGLVPRDLGIATIEVPDGAVPDQVTEADLPLNWRQHPPPRELVRIGSDWAISKRSLLLAVPSAVVPGEVNFLINPAHPEMVQVKLIDTQPYALDERLDRWDRENRMRWTSARTKSSDGV